MLIEDVTRKKIFDSQYWQQHCFYLTAETLVDRAIELRSFGGVTTAMGAPSDFLCLLLKMLLIQPDSAIPLMFIEEAEYRYVRLLGAFYIRLTHKPKDIYELLEPLYLDYRKLRLRTSDNSFDIVHMDDCIDQLLHSKQFCNIHLPPMVKRYKLEEAGVLQPRISPLQAEVEAVARQLAKEEEDNSSSSSSSSSVSEETKAERKRQRKAKKLAKKLESGAADEAIINDPYAQAALQNKKNKDRKKTMKKKKKKKTKKSKDEGQ